MRTVIAVCLLMLSGLVTAAQRCDCTSKLGSCEAQVAAAGDLIEITATSNECAEVIFYRDGYPHAALVTDGRAVLKQAGAEQQALVAGQCQRCSERVVMVEEKVAMAVDCPVELLQPTAQTSRCSADCQQLDNKAGRKDCQLACQQHSRCLDANCVEVLRNKYKQCQRQCDRDMQSSMTADITVLDSCMDECQSYKKQIASCPVL